MTDQIFSRTELASWIQVAIGIAALALTAMGAAGQIDSLMRVPEASDAGASAAIAATAMTFLICMGTAVGLLFLLVGLAAVLSATFRRLNARSPSHAASCVVILTLLVAISGTVGALLPQTFLWVVPAIPAVMCTILAGQAQADSGKEAFWTLAVLGTVACIGISGAVIFSHATPDCIATEIDPSTSQPSNSS